MDDVEEQHQEEGEEEEEEQQIGEEEEQVEEEDEQVEEDEEEEEQQQQVTYVYATQEADDDNSAPNDSDDEKKDSDDKYSAGGSNPKYRYDRRCPSCGSVLSTLYALKLHISKKHPEEEDDLIPLIKQTQWRCMQFPCTVDINCTIVCKGRKELLEHMQNEHNVSVNWIDHTFESRDDFEDFRRDLRNTGTVFIKATSRYKNNIGWAVYRCNREGNKDLRKNRPRQSYRTQSIKIGTFCTAYCKIYYEGDGVRAYGSTTHVNHEVNGIWPEHTMRAPAAEERLIEVHHDDGTVIQELVKVIDETATRVVRCEDEKQVIIATEDGDHGCHEKLDSLVQEACEELRTIFEECQTEPLVVYADRLRKFYRSLGEAVSQIVGDDIQAKRVRKSGNGSPVKRVRMGE